MITILTGLSGSGKTAILKESKLKNSFYADGYVKNVLYKKGTKLYQQIKDKFGENIVNAREVDTTQLGKLVFSDPNKLKELNSLVKPFVREWFKSLKGNSIIEMAAYINYEEEYKDLVDNVIMVVKKQPILDDKFTYMDSKKQPILTKNIKPDYIIENNKTITEASKKLIKLYKTITK